MGPRKIQENHGTRFTLLREGDKIGSSAPRWKPPYAPDVGVELPRYAGIPLEEPPRLTERVRYETASNTSNTTGNHAFPSAAR